MSDHLERLPWLLRWICIQSTKPGGIYIPLTTIIRLTVNVRFPITWLFIHVAATLDQDTLFIKGLFPCVVFM